MTQQSDPSYDDLDELLGPQGISFAAAALIRSASFDHRWADGAFDDQFFVVAENASSTSIHGWPIHLVSASSWSPSAWPLSGAGWARGAAVFLAMLSAILNFFVIPYYPF